MTRRPFAWFDRMVAPVLGGIAGTVLFGLMLVTCVDVVARYFLNKPITGSFEVTEMLLAALIFAGLPLVTLRGEHVTVDLLDPFLPDRWFRLQHVAACAVSFVCTAFLAWRLWVHAGKMLAAGETTAQLKITLAWLTYSMSVMMALTALAMLIVLARPPLRHVPGESEAPGT